MNEKNVNMIFFAADGKGLTSTSANHVANLAKEMVRGLETSSQSITLFSRAVALIGSDKSETLSQGATPEQLAELLPDLHSIAKAKSLIAWLREAIKAKEEMLKEVQNLSLKDYAEQLEIEIPEKPELGKGMTENDYFASLSLDERNRYYETETLAAVLGKAIHPGGALASARDALFNAIKNPRNVSGSGRDTLIFTLIPSVEISEVNNLYFQLQKQYREAQARLNSIKHDCEEALVESKIAADTAYSQALEEYNNKMCKLRADHAAHIKQRAKEIGDYKIVIPPSLKEIYDKVSHLGKKS